MTKKIVNADARTITFKFDDGAETVFDAGKVPDSIRAQAELHGYSQKIGDSYAGAGKSSDPLAFAKAAVDDMIAQLYAGDWNAGREGSGPRVSILAMALARVTGQDLADVSAKVAEFTEEQVKAYKAKPKVAAAIAAITAERAAERAAELAKKAGIAPAEGEQDEEVTL